MTFRNIRELSERIAASLPLLRNVDAQCVVGIPRSGMLAASMAALYLNLPLSDVFSYVQGRAWWRQQNLDGPRRSILLMDDSLNSGAAMRAAVQAIRDSVSDLSICRIAVFGRSTSVELDHADLILEPLDGERVFEWNLWKHRLLESAMCDLDGVLSRDPTPEENDDGPRYRRFLETAEPLYIPARRLGWITTARLEKYREPTIAWLERHGIEYRGLTMLDLPNAEMRRRQGGHAAFKAAVFRDSRMKLFIESDSRQAARIAQASHKPVIAIDARTLFA